MRIRLLVRPSPAEAFEWEHAGPCIRIGRGDDCQLVFRGEPAQLVSSEHAQLELATAGARLTDLGSRNGTFVNGAALVGSTRLAIGDHIYLGRAGPRLEVLWLDLSPAGATPMGFARTAPNGCDYAGPAPILASPARASRTLRVFIGSPGDVKLERETAAKIVQGLANAYAGVCHIESVLWEDYPMAATDTFQSQIPRPSNFDVFVCILWTRLGTALHESHRRPDGSRYESGTEFEYEDALESWRRRKAPDIFVYRKQSELLISTTDKSAREKISQHEKVKAFFDKHFRAADGSFKGAYTEFENAGDLEDRLKLHLGSIVKRRIEKLGLAQDEVQNARRVTWHGDPYRGLEVFDFEHKDIFFGRTRAVSAVIGAWQKQAAEGTPFVLVVGASGSGKSSLVRAGVIPMLTRPGVVAGAAAWRRAVFRVSTAGDNLWLGLSQALLAPAALPELRERGSHELRLAQLLKESPIKALEQIKEALGYCEASNDDPAHGARNLVLLLDQLEEVFTLARATPGERTAFFRVVELLTQVGVWSIATIRSDFYHRCLEAPELVRLKGADGQIDLQPPTAGELAAMIREPALAAGLHFERDRQTGEGLDEILANAAAASPDSLPLLQFTLGELFKRRSGNLLTVAAYSELGGLEGALATRAGEVFAGLQPLVQAELPRLFRQLVSIASGTDVPPTRRPAPVSRLTANRSLRALFDAFVEARLITAHSDGEGAAVAEITHEALLTRWQPLQDWLASDKELLQIHGRVAAAAREWELHRRSREWLLDGGLPLEEAKQLVRAGFDLTESEAWFITNSMRRAQRAKRVRQATIVALGVLLFAATLAWGKAFNESRKTAKQNEQLKHFEAAYKSASQLLKAEDVRHQVDLAKHEQGASIYLESRNELAQSMPEDPDIEPARAEAELVLGMIQAWVGSYRSAEDNLQSAAKRYRALARTRRGEPKYRLGECRALLELGWLYFDDNRPAAARGRFEQALIRLEKEYERSPDSPEVRYDLATCLVRLGGCLPENSAVEKRTELADRAAGLFESLIDKKHREADSRAGLAVAKYRLLWAGFNGKDQQSLLDGLGEIAALDDRAINSGPIESPYLKSFAVFTRRDKADALTQCARRPEALAEREKALQTIRQISESSPEMPRYAVLWAQTCKEFAWDLWRAARPSDAQLRFQEAARLLDGYVDRFPDRANVAAQWLDMRNELASFLEIGPKPDGEVQASLDLLRALEETANRGRELAEEFKDHRALQVNFAKAAAALGRLHIQGSRYREAMPWLQQCESVYREQILEHADSGSGDKESYLTQLQAAAACAGNLGEGAECQRLGNLALKYREFCTTPDRADNFCSVLIEAAKAHRQAQNFDEAIRLLKQTAEVGRATLDKVPWHWYLETRLGATYQNLADIYHETNDYRNEVQVNREYIRLIAAPRYGAKLDEAPAGDAANDELQAEHLREVIKSALASGMKRFTISCDFNGGKQGIHFYITNVPPPKHPLEDQARWLKEERGGVVPKEVMDSFEKLQKIAHENNVSFVDLCVYALAAASPQKSDFEIDNLQDLPNASVSPEESLPRLVQAKAALDQSPDDPAAWSRAADAYGEYGQRSLVTNAKQASVDALGESVRLRERLISRSPQNTEQRIALASALVWQAKALVMPSGDKEVDQSNANKANDARAGEYRAAYACLLRSLDVLEQTYHGQSDEAQRATLATRQRMLGELAERQGDAAAAVHWYTRAVVQGNSPAAIQLAMLLQSDSKSELTLLELLPTDLRRIYDLIKERDKPASKEDFAKTFAERTYSHRVQE